MVADMDSVESVDVRENCCCSVVIQRRVAVVLVQVRVRNATVEDLVGTTNDADADDADDADDDDNNNNSDDDDDGMVIRACAMIIMP